MKINQSLLRASLVAWALLGIALLATFPARLRGRAENSQSQSNPHDLSARVTAFGNYVKDFRAMEKPLQGEELEVLRFLDQVATTAEDRLGAANTLLQMYDSISCKPDRVRAKRILKAQLDYYSWVFDSEVTRVTGGLTFVKVPAAAQIGLRMKDDLRAAKEKLDAIAASVN